MSRQAKQWSGSCFEPCRAAVTFTSAALACSSCLPRPAGPSLQQDFYRPLNLNGAKPDPLHFTPALQASLHTRLKLSAHIDLGLCFTPLLCLWQRVSVCLRTCSDAPPHGPLGHRL